jgi:hypothetical protein
MAEIRIFTPSLDWTDVCAAPESIQFARELYGAGTFEIHVHPDKRGAAALATRGNIIMINGDRRFTGIVRNFTISEDKDKTELVVYGETLNGILRQRLVVPHMNFARFTQNSAGTAYDARSGSPETVMKAYAAAHAGLDAEADRIIPILTVSDDLSRGDPLDWQARYTPLLEELTAIGQYAGVGFAVEFDPAELCLVFDTIHGTDRTVGNGDVSPVAFNTKYQNVGAYSYSENWDEYASTAYAGGAGEDAARAIAVKGGDAAGLDRFEAFVDCGNVTGAELDAAAVVKLSELAPVKSIEADALPRAFTFGEDYFLGDLVTLYVARLGLEIPSRVTAAKDVWERERGHAVEIRFGERLPNIFTAGISRKTGVVR